MEEGRWRGDGLGALAQKLGLVAEEGFRLTDDEFGATLCAITLLAEDECRLGGLELAREIESRIGQRMGRFDGKPENLTPAGYVTLRYSSFPMMGTVSLQPQNSPGQKRTSGASVADMESKGRVMPGEHATAR